jgi:hypothetical protein
MLSLVTEQTAWLKSLVNNRPIKPDELDAVTAKYVFAARDDFAYFRCLMRPGMITSWWTREIARAMQKFYDDLIAGKRPMLAIGSPPQHGKSWAATDLIANEMQFILAHARAPRYQSRDAVQPGSCTICRVFLNPLKAAASSFAVEAIAAPVRDLSELESVVAA